MELTRIELFNAMNSKDIPNIKDLLGEPKRIKSNRPHYNDVTDEIILEVCKIFLSLN
jgi:hypothetical protein